MKEYALYKGDELLSKRKTRNPRILIELEEDDG